MGMTKGEPASPDAALSDVLLRAIEAAKVSITVADSSAEQRLVYANSAFVRLTGYPLAEVLGRNCNFLQGPDSDAEQIAIIREALDDGRDASAVITNYRRDNTPFWNELSISVVRSSAGHITHYIGTQVDVTCRVERERELSLLAHSDPLTGLTNRRQVLARLDQMLPPVGDEKLLVIVADLHGFHRINEDFDFETGNLVLAGVAERLRSAASPGDIIGRLDSDRFVIIRRAPAADCAMVGQQIVAALELRLRAPIATPEIAIMVRANWGIAIAPDDGGTSTALLEVGRARVEAVRPPLRRHRERSHGS